MKQSRCQKEIIYFTVNSLLALLMTLLFVSVESHTHENILDLVRRRPGIPPEYLGYMEHTSTLSKGRKRMNDCLLLNPFLKMEVDTEGPLEDVQNVSVTVRGVFNPDKDDWIAVISPSEANFTENCPYVKFLYLETGDDLPLPLLCQYPVKFQHLKADSQYLTCEEPECHKELGKLCLAQTCSGSITFRLINIRSDVIFVFFGHGLMQPCILQSSAPLSFANPLSPLYGHLSSVNSAADSMRVTWVTGDDELQYVIFGQDNKLAIESSVTTFERSDMCDTDLGPANGFGWHDPGYIHTAVLTGLSPSASHEYQYGSDKAGWSKKISFRTPPAAGALEVKVIMYSDMGKNERDGSNEHFLQEGALDVIDAVSKEVDAGVVDAVFHTGDISYATGFLVEWDAFLEMVTPVASRVPYMTASGNHERDFPESGSVYHTTDSGGECGVPYETYFQMPSQGADKPWYSVEYGPVHFTVMSTEMEWTYGSEQYVWLEEDLAAVNRSVTPWVIFSGHRPLYSSIVADSIASKIIHSVDTKMTQAIEPLLLQHKVDVATWGHVHQYERTCATEKNKCVHKPIKNTDGIDTYNSLSYAGPVHLVIGMAGFHLDRFAAMPADWSLVRISEYGYTRLHATHDRLQFQSWMMNPSMLMNPSMFVNIFTACTGKNWSSWRPFRDLEITYTKSTKSNTNP